MSDTRGQIRTPRAAGAAPPPEPQVPAEYLSHLLEIAGRFHVRPEVLLKGTGVPVRALDELGAVVAKDVFMLVVERALALTGEPGLGFYHGLSLKLSSHGALGMLAMTSGTLRDAIAVAERYMRLRAPELSLHTWQEGDFFAAEFQDHVPAHLRLFFSESMFVMLVQLARTLLGHPIAVRCEMAFARPAHFHRFAHLLPGNVSFDAESNRIWLPRALLDEAVVTADAVTARRLERECQRELSALRKQASVLVEVRRHLRGAQGEYPSLEQVAKRMGSSSRTLKRRLAQQGTSYRAIVDGLRRERASMLLKTSTLTLEQIAGMTGYSDVASLHRSFRRWFKQTPTSLRGPAGS